MCNVCVLNQASKASTQTPIVSHTLCSQPVQPFQAVKPRQDDRPYSLERRVTVLSTLVPSSSCSATSRTGNSAGIILRGLAPSTSEYFEKSVTPHCRRRKSSSSSNKPFTFSVGARKISSIASPKIVFIHHQTYVGLSESTYWLPQVLFFLWLFVRPLLCGSGFYGLSRLVIPQLTMIHANSRQQARYS